MRVERYQGNITKSCEPHIWRSCFECSIFDLKHISGILSSISEHQYVATAFYEQSWFISFKDKNKQEVYFDLKETYDFDKDAFYLNFRKILQNNTNITTNNISIFNLYDPKLDTKILFILFSEIDNNISQSFEHIQTIQKYLGEQEKFAKLSIEQITLQEKLATLEQINEGRTKYLSVISHDLRAPFHGILGCVDILMSEAETLTEADKTKLIEYVYDTSHSTYTLLENLLSWSMIDGGKFVLKKVHFRISDVVQMILDLLCASAYKKQIKLECSLEASLYVYADINMVTSILQNLVSNALKFTLNHANKSIYIRTQTEDNRVKISVEDQGIGLTQSQLNRLFQENSISTTPGTKGEKGTGLGLVLCKKFAEMNDGEIQVNSVVNQGTTFSLFFPIGNKEI